MWLIVLSDQLPIVALVGSYPTNQLIGHGPSFQRLATLLSLVKGRAHAVLSAISRRYSSLKDRSPMCSSPVRHSLPVARKRVRLACVRHAASVYPEPGSNSPSNVSICTHALASTGHWCIVLSCDPGQAVSSLLCINTWLFADCCLASTGRGTASRRDQIDRNCTSSMSVLWWALSQPHACACGWPTAHHSCCSAFHSSIVKVALK